MFQKQNKQFVCGAKHHLNTSNAGELRRTWVDWVTSAACTLLWQGTSCRQWSSNVRRKFKKTFPGILKVFIKSLSCNLKVQNLLWQLFSVYLKYGVCDAGQCLFVRNLSNFEHIHSPFLRIFQNLKNKIILGYKNFLKVTFTFANSASC